MASTLEKQKTIVLTAGSLGDCLLTLPALQFLQSSAPVTVAGTFPYSSLGADLMGVQEILSLEKVLQNLMTNGPDPFWSYYSDAYLFFKEPDDNILKKILEIPGLKIHQSAKTFDEFLKEARWAAEYWLETAAGKSLPPDSPFRLSKLRIGDAMRKKGETILSSLGLSAPLVIHPGSGSPAKNAPLSFFRNAAERAVKESQKQVLVVWGEAEEKNIDQIRKAFGDLKDVQVLNQPLELRDLAAVFSQSAVFLGNDSGVTQLASACGLRTFAVFSSTDSRIWGPQEAIILEAMKNLYTS